MKAVRITHYVSTGLLSAMMVLSAAMFIFSYGETAANFKALGYPTYVIYPLAAAKILGAAAIWNNFSRTLREWAYAGFFFNFVLALTAHLNAADGNWPGAAFALVLWAVSYFSGKKARSEE